jgi:preprotein translocase subunit SecG
MPQSNDQYLRWPVPEYRNPERSKTWYILAVIFIFIALFFCFFTFQSWHLVWLGLSSNFLFALFIIIAIIIMIINNNQSPLMANIELGPEGVRIGQKFYDYDEIKNFAVLYKPKQSVKNLYFEMKNSIHPRVSIPLRHMDALTVRNFLVRYLEENLERTEVPLSEQLTKVLKL